MEDIKFKHLVPIQLRFSDFDSMGLVYNGVYLSFFDLGKSYYFNDVLPDMNAHKDMGVVVAKNYVNYFLPVYPNEKVAVETAVMEIGHKSIKLNQRLIDAETHEVKSFCETVVVGFDVKTRTSTVISDAWRKAISAFEGRDFTKTE